MPLDLATIAALAAQGCVVRVLPDGSLEVSASAEGSKEGGPLVPQDRTAAGTREGCGDATTMDTPGPEAPAPCGDSPAPTTRILTPKQKRAARNKRYRSRLKTALAAGTASASQRERVSAAASRRALRRVEGVSAKARSVSLPGESVSAPARNAPLFAGCVSAAAQSVPPSAESVSPLAESVSAAVQSVSPVVKTEAAPRPLPLSPQTPLSPAPTPGHTHVPVPAYEADALPEEAASAALCSTPASTASAAEASDSAGESANEDSTATAVGNCNGNDSDRNNANGNTNAAASICDTGLTDASAKAGAITNANANTHAAAAADASAGTKADADADTGLKAKPNASDDTAAAGEKFALQHPDPAEVTGRRGRKAKAKTNAPKEPKAPKPVAADDEQWLKSLAENVGYAGLNIPMELARMQAWCALRQKQPTRRRFLNWLNHAVGDRVMAAPSTPGPGTPLSPSTYPYASHRLPPRHRSDSANRPGRYTSAASRR